MNGDDDSDSEKKGESAVGHFLNAFRKIGGSTEEAKGTTTKIRRVCDKDGAANVKYKNVSEKRRRYVADLFTTMVDSTWTTIIIMFALRCGIHILAF